MAMYLYGMDELTSLELKVKNLPLKPGVYLFKDRKDKILYVGKARKLKNRVSSYFQQSKNHSPRIDLMVSKIIDVEVFVVDSESEALILENELIKKHHPRYNVMYRDDKSYPYICVTNEERPRVFPTRTVIKDGSTYYGPYDHVGHMKRMLEVIRESYDLCTCAVSSKSIDRTRNLPKWNSCVRKFFESCSEQLNSDLYADRLKSIQRILDGKTDLLLKELKEEMQIASQALDFEAAARIRDRMHSIQKYSDRMKVVDKHDVSRDVFALATEAEQNIGCGVLLKVREGKLLGKFHRFIKNIEGIEESELLQSFIEDYYTGQHAGSVPEEVYVQEELPDSAPLIAYLNDELGKKVLFRSPQRGEKAALISMAEKNARLLLNEKVIELMKADGERIPHSVKQLQKDLNLSRLPRRIECFDNSNFQGTDPVASMVCFVDGQPRKSEYKRFKIKTVEGPDDFASMREVLTRRYSRLLKEGGHLPDLIIVDGGKGQLSSAVDALKNIDYLGNSDLIGLAKRLEEVFKPGFADPFMIPKNSSALKLIQRARDEAHRFAITFHRERRKNRTFTTELTAIQGVGNKMAEKLLKEIGSLKKIKEAEEVQLKSVVGPVLAAKIWSHFHPKEA